MTKKETEVRNDLKKYIELVAMNETKNIVADVMFMHEANEQETEVYLVGEYCKTTKSGNIYKIAETETAIDNLLDSVREMRQISSLPIIVMHIDDEADLKI